MSGKPNVIIHNGKLIKSEMKKIRFNKDDLKEQLRIQGYTGIKNIHFAILETNGQLSIIPKAQNKQSNTEDEQNITDGKGKNK